MNAQQLREAVCNLSWSGVKRASEIGIMLGLPPRDRNRLGALLYKYHEDLGLARAPAKYRSVDVAGYRVLRVSKSSEEMGRVQKTKIAIRNNPWEGKKRLGELMEHLGLPPSVYGYLGRVLLGMEGISFEYQKHLGRNVRYFYCKGPTTPVQPKLDKPTEEIPQKLDLSVLLRKGVTVSFDTPRDMALFLKTIKLTDSARERLTNTLIEFLAQDA